MAFCWIKEKEKQYKKIVEEATNPEYKKERIRDVLYGIGTSNMVNLEGT